MLAPCPQAEATKLAELPGARADSKVELWSREGEGGEPLVDLVEYSWGSGLGWYVQKRMTLEAGQVEALCAAFAGPDCGPCFRLKRPAPEMTREGNVIRLAFGG